MSAVRRAVSGWPLWDLPRPVQLLVIGLVTVYGAAIAAAAALTRIHAADLRVFGVLLACTVISVELTRRVGEPDGVVRDVYAIWDLPVAVLLPPLYIMLVAAVRMSLTQLRVRRTIIHRRTYTAACMGLAYAAASVIFHAAEPVVLGGGAGAGTGIRALLWTLLAAGCGIVRVFISDSLLLAAIRGVDPQTPVKSELIGAEASVGNAAELCLGLLVTFAAAHSVLVVVFAMPLVIWQQRSVRHNQLASAARIDRKTGLLNDPTWRAEAADEVARAARTRTPVAVGILDVDHFKLVNDTYGHPAGDAVLAAVAAATMGTLREGDVVGRIGGEEFAFLLPYTPAGEAIEVAERLRSIIPRIAIPETSPGSPAPPGVTVSIGVMAARQASWSLDEFVGHADRAMYAAKHNGRDRVYVITPESAGDLQPRPSTNVRAADGRDGRNGSGAA